MNVFLIKRNTSNESYIRNTLAHFIDKKREKINIYFDEKYIRIVINEYYCSICNALLYLLKNDEVKATLRSLKWLNKYKEA